MTPRIAMPVPTTIDLPYNQRAVGKYEAAIRSSGGEPVEVPLDLELGPLLELIRSCDGVCLPGSPADVDPGLYGEARHPATARADGPRERVDYLLLEEAVKVGRPVLGICFGVQSLNVWRGGSLVQDVTPLPVNHEAGSKVAVAHAALIVPGSVLGGMVAKEEATEGDEFLRLLINTSHHQAVSRVGDGLRVVARCPDDGVVEAVEIDPAVFHVEHPQFLVGVQWHPERSYEISATSRALFDRLVVEAREFAARNAGS